MFMKFRISLAAALSTLLFAFSVLPGANLAAQAEAQEKADFAALLKQTDLERATVLAELQDFDPAEFIQQGERELAAYWQAEDVSAAFQRHYRDIERIIAQVHIDPRFDTLDTLWAQYKSFYDDEKLNEISDAFVRDTLQAIQTTQESFIEETLTGFREHANSVYEETQRDIGRELDRIVRKQFDYWPELASNPASITLRPEDIQGPQRAGAPMVGFAGALLLILRKQIAGTIVKIVGGKVLGQVAAKFVPVVGALLLVWDVVDATQAKVQLEDKLREIFVEQYRVALTPELFWDKSRQEVRTEFRKGIDRWVEATRVDIERMMERDVAVLIQNPSFEAYAEEMLKKGHNLEQVAEQLRALREDFGPLSNELAIDQMYDIRSLLPREAAAERGFLPRLIDVFGADFVPLVDHHKRLFLEVAWEIGPENLRELLARGLDPREVYDSYRKSLNRDDSANAKKGFILAWHMGLDLRPGKINAAFLEKLFANRDLAEQLQRDEVPQDKLIGILASDKVRGIVANVYAKDAILGGGFARGFDLVEMDNRYADPRQVTDLVNLFHQQHPGADRATSDRFIQEIREDSWKADIFSRHGQTGLEIAAAHIKGEPSAYELEMTKKAIALYEQGYPLDVVKDRQAVDYAHDYSALGQSFFNLTYPIQKHLGSLGTLILGLVVVVTLAYLGGFLSRRFRPAPALATGTVSPPPPAPYSVRGVGKNASRQVGPQPGGMPRPAASPGLPAGPEAHGAPAKPAGPEAPGAPAKPAALPPTVGGRNQRDGDEGGEAQKGNQTEEGKTS